MKVYGYKDNAKGIMEIENTHTAFREFVRGDIEIMSLSGELRVVCNTESSPDMGKMELNVAWFDNDELVDIICGDCFVCRYIGDHFSSIENSDIPIINKLLKY